MAVPSEKAVTLAEFSDALDRLSPVSLEAETDVAVALSGGGDSMALTCLLSKWCAKRSIKLHALTVDHGLRVESAAEARQVGGWVKNWPGITHKILKWAGDKPATKIQEEARAARYRLLSAYCHKNKIRYLFLAHHANDQVETILFRLAKGSGLDGLAGMANMQIHSPHLMLVRPLLEMTHERLIKTCKTAKIPWVEDKSNASDRYARIRLRKSMDVLEAEGLSVSRIMTLGARLDRARKALDQTTDLAWKNCLISRETKLIVFNYKPLVMYPDEVVLRLLMRALQSFRVGKAYPPRLENLEALVRRLLDPAGSFKAATLGGCIVRRKVKDGLLVVTPEIG